MQLNIISSKALKLLQNIKSLEKINKILLPLNEDFKKDEPYEYFKIKDYYPHIYEESICLLIELSIMLRKKSELFEKYGMSIYKKVKYSNTTKYMLSNKDISFLETLSKIIHAYKIVFQMKDKHNSIGYGYEIDRNCSFTGKAIIEGKEKDDSVFQVLIDVEKICVNAFMLGADEYIMI